MTNWYQYIKIFGLKLRGKVYHQLIFDPNNPPREFPPKDREFFVYCVDREEEESDHIYSTDRGSVSIRGRGRTTIWIGQAMWNDERKRFEVRTNSTNPEERKLSYTDFPKGILWSYDLPLNLISKR